MAKYGLNKVMLIGNLGQDPELKYTEQGIPLTTISLACTERVRTQDGNYDDRTNWVRVNLWRSQAEIAHKYLRKGSTVYIEAKLRQSSWETPQGEKRSRLDLDATQLILLDGRPGSGGAPSNPQSMSQPSAYANPSSTPDSSPSTDPEIDDLPF